MNEFAGKTAAMAKTAHEKGKDEKRCCRRSTR